MKMPKRIRVKVTAADIREGRPRACDGCPIAIALGNKDFLAEVQEDIVYLRGGIHYDNRASYKVSRAARRFIIAFDSCRSVKPTTFIFTRIRRK